MSRGDQLARQWRILQTLVSRRRGMSVGDLAREEDCSPRTIYRDLEALQAAGFPMMTERSADRRILWRFVDGYKLQIPIPFDIDELMALYFSRGMTRIFKGTVFHDSLESLFGKIRNSLAPETLALVERFENVFECGQRPFKDYGRYRAIINQVNTACAQQRRIEIVYFTQSRGEECRRKVDPYRVWYAEGSLYLIAYCHWRKEIRMFSLDRIRLLNITPEAFVAPRDFSAEQYMARCFRLIHDELVTVRVRFTGKAAAWVADRLWHPSQEVKAHKDGSITASYQVGGTSEIKRWVLGFGPMAEVLEPRSLKEDILAEASRLITLYRGRKGNRAEAGRG